MRTSVVRSLIAWRDRNDTMIFVTVAQLSPLTTTSGEIGVRLRLNAGQRKSLLKALSDGSVRG